MPRTSSIVFEPSRLIAEIKKAEKAQTFANRSRLYEFILASEWGQSVSGLTLATLTQRITALVTSNMIQLKTKKGKKGRASAPFDLKAALAKVEEFDSPQLESKGKLWELVAESLGCTPVCVYQKCLPLIKSGKLKIKAPRSKKNGLTPHAATPVDVSALLAAIKRIDSPNLTSRTALWNAVSEATGIKASLVISRIKPLLESGELKLLTPLGKAFGDGTTGRGRQRIQYDHAELVDMTRKIDAAADFTNRGQLWKAVAKHLNFNESFVMAKLKPALESGELILTTPCRVRSSSSEVAEAKDYITYEEAGPRRKQCPECNVFISRRVQQCNCGYEFPADVVAQVEYHRDDIEAKKSLLRFGGSSYRTVLTPSGPCPFNLTTSLNDWIEEVIAHGHKNAIAYAPSALRFWLRGFVQIGSQEYQAICEEITDYMTQGIEQIQEISEPVAA